ncbi:MAG: hypothetical protein OHK0028_22760 [Deltaproteobacteria bacterium]
MRHGSARHIAPFVWALVVAFVFAGGAGCSKEQTAPTPVVKKQAPKPGAKAPAVAAQAAPAQAASQPASAAPSALYDPRGKRDPFLPFVKAETRARTAREAAALPPLQRYDVGELKFVGVIWTKKGARGLVEDAEGKGYSVTVGTRIGRSGGVVTRITDREIVVREEFVGQRGEKVVRESGMELTTAGGK